MTTIRLFYNFQIQERIVSKETIWGNIVFIILLWRPLLNLTASADRGVVQPTNKRNTYDARKFPFFTSVPYVNVYVICRYFSLLYFLVKDPPWKNTRFLLEVAWFQKVFHFGSSLQKLVPNPPPGHFFSRWIALRREIGVSFGRLKPKWKTFWDQATFTNDSGEKNNFL